MKKGVLAALILCLASVLPAAAAQGPYVGVAGGLAIVHDSDIEDLPGIDDRDAEFDVGFGFNVSAGMRFDQMRCDAEFGLNNADFDNIEGGGVDGDVTTMSFMLNGYYDLKIPAPVTPFFGVGLGFINGEFEVEGEEGDDTNFGYQLTAGVTSNINQFLDLDLYYRYQGAPDFEDNGVEISYDSSLIFAGLRYSF